MWKESCLFKHQLGLSSHLRRQRAISSTLFSSMQLSDSSFERVFCNAVSYIDLEKDEDRYLIVGYRNGGIAIYDKKWPISDKDIPVVTSVNSSDPQHSSVDVIQWYPHDTGMFTALSSDRTVKIWDTNAMVVAEKYTFEKDVLHFHMSHHRTQPLIAVGSKDSNIYLCDIVSGSKTHTLRGHKSAITAVQWSPRDEHLLISGSHTGNMYVWDVRKTQNLLRTFERECVVKNSKLSKPHERSINGLVFVQNGFIVLSYGTGGELYSWDVQSGSEIKVPYGKLKNSLGRPIQMAVTTNLRDDVIFVPTGLNVDVFEIASGKYLRTLTGHFKPVSCCYYSDALQELITGSSDTKILLWDNRHSDKKTSQTTLYQDDWSD